MQIILISLLLMLMPPQASSADPCDSLYTVAKKARATVDSGIGKARTAPEEKQQWRRKAQRLQSAIEQVRTCYGPLPSPNRAAPPASAEESLPAPSSKVRQRLMQTYRWGVLAHRELQQYEAAFQEYEAFFRRFGAISDSSQVGFMYNSRGYLHYRLGNLTQAINDYTHTLAYTPSADTLNRAALLIDLGTILQKANDLYMAQQNYRQAERLVRKTGPASERQRELRARALFAQGDVLLQDWPGDKDSTRMARYQQAIPLIQQAIALHPEGDWGRLPRAHITLGEAYRLVGNLEAAFRHLEQGQELAASDAAGTYQTDVLALAALARGKTEIAAERFDAASASLEEAIRFADLGNHHHYRLEALQELGSLHERQGNLEHAESHYRRAITVTEELRASLRATDWATATFNEWVTSHRGLVRVLAAQGQHRAAFWALERTRARHLQDVRLQARITSTLPPTKRVRFDSLTAALTETRNHLAQADRSENEKEQLRSNETELMAQRRSLVGLDARLKLPPLDELQTHLRARRQTLISFFVADPPFGQMARSLAFVVTADSFHTVSLSTSSEDLEAQLAMVSPVLTRNADAPPDLNATRFNLKALHRLHSQLIAPLDSLLPGKGRLVILPDGPLFRLPLGMLTSAASGRFTYANAQYLIEEHPLATELSTALLTDTSTARRSFTYDLVALGQTRFRSNQSLPSTLEQAPKSAAALSPLPGVNRETHALRDLFARRQILLDDEATEAALYMYQNQTRVLHLASHAVVDATNPRNSLFVLTAESDTSAHDGLLFMHELESHHTPIPLVVLSGCSTARGLHLSGEGPQGLQYAFRAMGAQSTLSTLWPTDDEAAVSITTSFYRHLQNGAPKDVALQRAQLNFLREHGAKASPFFWAGPVLYGNTRPLDLKAASHSTAYLIGGALLLLAVLGYTYRRWPLSV